MICLDFNVSHAEAYDLFFPKHITNYYVKKRVDFLKRFSRKDSKILDVGCGTGNVLLELSNFAKESYGVDDSENMIKKSKQKLNKNRVKFFVGSATKIRFPNNFFDLTYSIAAFHHIKTPQKVRDSIKEMLRVTKHGGYVVIIDHNSRNFYWKFLMKRIPWDRDTRLIPLKEFLESLDGNKISVSYQSFVPEFCPKSLLNTFSKIESFIEGNFLGKLMAAHVAIVATKTEHSYKRFSNKP